MVAKNRAEHFVSLSEALKVLADFDYDFVCCLSLLDGSMKVLISKDESAVPYLLKDNASYFDNIKTFIEHSVTPEARDNVLQKMSFEKVVSMLKSTSTYNVVLPINLPNGEILFKKWRFNKVPRKPEYAVFTRSDVTSEIMGEYDPLTGVLESNPFYLWLKRLVSGNPIDKYLLLFIDIDNFKSYNKIFGLQKGDDLLRFFASSLQKISLNKGLLARLHGDDFVMALKTGDFLKEEFENFYADLVNYNKNFIFSVSIGVSTPIAGPEDLRLSFEEAHQANRSLKGVRGFGIASFEPSMAEEAIVSQTLISSLMEAFNNDEFFICLQPIIDSRSSKVLMAEALARWKSPTRGIVYPDLFIPAMEENGMVVELDKVVRRKVYAYLRNRMGASLPLFPISVNISRAELEHPSFVDNLCSELDAFKIPVDLVRLEITETMLAQKRSYFFKNVMILKEKGFFLEMDDCGSGYSSLLALRDVPFDLIKLDMKFFHDEGNGKSLSIVAAAIGLAKALEVSVISEGVESKNIVDFLSSHGSYYIQGYYYSKPLSVPDFDKYALEHGSVPFDTKL